jgi:hypothetical protein
LSKATHWQNIDQFAKNLDDIVWNIMECGAKHKEKHITYLDRETQVYMLLSIFDKTKEDVDECYDCISTETEGECFNFYDRHFSNSWPLTNIEYLMHLVVCNAQNGKQLMPDIAAKYNNTPTAPGEFVVFVIA